MKVEPVHLDVGASPVFMKARSLAFGLRPAVENNLRSLVADGILRPVKSSSWATPIVVVPKPSDARVRICGDYRITVNRHIKQTGTTTLEVDDMFLGMQGCKFFSKLDLSNAFLQVPLDEPSKEVTTINTMFGLFQYNFLPFGLNVWPGIFQRAIDEVLAGRPNVRSYQDDIIIFTKSRADHYQVLVELLTVLQARNVCINAKKSIICADRIRYLGYYLDGKGISPDVERIRALKEAPVPSTPEKLKSFLGFVQYYSKFVPGFADVARPLFDLLSEKHNFRWSSTAEKAYKDLLSSVINGKVLTSFQTGVELELVVDASEYAIGAVLEQHQQPVICVSQRLSKAERNHGQQTQKEVLAIHWAVRRLHKSFRSHRSQSAGILIQSNSLGQQI
jgi:hypothetical protein